MPELPEVETIARDLRKNILGKKILKAEVLEPKTVGFLVKTFKNKVEGKTIKKIERRAKILIFDLSDRLFLMFHLKITGQLVLLAAKGKIDRFTRVVFFFAGGKKLLFNDLRKFGYIKLFNEKGLQKQLSLLKFGPEPLEKSFTLAVFVKILSRRKNMPIKPLLMDQTLMAGVGNIYASEACFLAGIKPTRRAGSLKDPEVKKIYEAIKSVLKLSLKYRGTSADAYVDAFGRPGDFEKRLKVYGRKGERCWRCGGQILRITQAGRGTFYCPACQK